MPLLGTLILLFERRELGGKLRRVTLLSIPSLKAVSNAFFHIHFTFFK